MRSIKNKKKIKVYLIIESGIDVRFVERLDEEFYLKIISRKREGGFEISQKPKNDVFIKIGPSSRIKFAYFVMKELLKNRKKVDFIITQEYSITTLIVNLINYFIKIPSAMWINRPIELYYYCRKKSLGSKKKFKWMEFLGIKIVAKINAKIGMQYIVVSEHLKEVVKTHGTKKPIKIIPAWGVNTDFFLPYKINKKKIRKKLNLPVDSSLVFFCSRIAPEKDAKTLLIAIKYLTNSGRNIWLLNRSGGYKSFIKYAKKIGISNRVIATDAVHPYKELPDSYNACDLCIQASNEEGLGLSPLEALSCEIPVIASSVGGLKETIIDGKTGWTYPVGDYIALAKCIEEVLDNPKEAIKRAKNGRKEVLAKYDSKIAFKKWFKLIESQIKNKLH
jgi:glycosyltransferase involved in cell wall biosynthesis